MSVKDAKEYLTLHNNYFKLASYRKNFPKHPGGPHAGTYIDLDFAMLKDLSIIDMYLRYTLLQMALDIEHFAQVRLMRAVESSGNDGYQIVTDYMEALRANDAKTGRHSYEILQQDLNRNRNSSYCGGIISAYNGSYPVWAFVEIIPFGDFVHFYKFCGNAFQCKDMINQYYLLQTTKELRNAAAHNNCIINDISSKNSRYKCNHGCSVHWTVFQNPPEIGNSSTNTFGKLLRCSIRTRLSLQAMGYTEWSGMHFIN